MRRIINNILIHAVSYITAVMIVAGAFFTCDLLAANTGTVTVDSLNVRSVASSDGEVLGKLSNGEKVDIIGTEDGWYKIDYNGQEGYVAEKYVEYSEPEEAIEDSEGDMESNDSADASTVADEEEEIEGGSDSIKTMLILGGAILVILLIAVLTFKSIRKLDDEDYDDYDEDYDDEDYEDDYEDDYEEEYRPKKSRKPVERPVSSPRRELHNSQNGNKPSSKPGSRPRDNGESRPVRKAPSASYEQDTHQAVKYMSNNPDDYRIDIDPSFFEKTGVLPNVEEELARMDNSRSQVSESKKEADLAAAMKKMEELQREIERIKNE